MPVILATWEAKIRVQSQPRKIFVKPSLENTQTKKK
jgi:hypothetical protein